MYLIRYGLLLLSFIQIVFNESFWRGGFYYFFILIISYQINWFYLTNLRYRQVNYLIMTLLTIISLLQLQTFPLLMLVLLLLETLDLFTQKTTGILAALWAIIIAYLIYTHSINITADNLLLLLATLGLSVISYQLNEQNKAQTKRWYELQVQQDLLQKDVIALNRQMKSMEEVHTLNERNRISRDLHDTVGHTLSTIVIQLSAIKQLVEPTHQQAGQMLDHLNEFAKEGLQNVRQVIHEMKPPQFAKIALVERMTQLIANFESNSPIKVYFNYNQLLWQLSETQEELVMRALQEFLANSSKHSQATEVRIQFHFTETSVILTMKDNGKGADKIEEQMGMKGMRERTKLLGGTVAFQTAPEKGFTTRITLPKGGGQNVTSH